MISIFAIILYLIATLYQLICLTKGYRSSNLLLNLIGLAAITLHAMSIYTSMYTAQGVNLGIFKVSALISWFIALLAILTNLRQPLANLFLLIFPLAIITLLLALTVEESHYLREQLTPGMLSHILLSILAYSVLTIAAIQAVFLAIQDYRLKHFASKFFMQNFPPLETMERLLFQLISVGIALLSCSIITGFIFLDDLFAQHLVHKTALAIIAWFVFSILLLGRHYLGWRGTTAIHWTLSGFGFLMLAYFGSKFVLELILHRT